MQYFQELLDSSSSNSSFHSTRSSTKRGDLAVEVQRIMNVGAGLALLLCSVFTGMQRLIKYSASDFDRHRR